MVKIVVGAAALIAVGVLAAWLAGRRLPREHRRSVEGPLDAGCDAVFARITDVEGLPSWRPGVKAAQRLSATTHREVTGHGTLSFETEEALSGRRLVTRIVEEEGQPFGGRWIFELSPREGGCRLRITEDGWVGPPLYRFAMRYVFGESRTLEEYMRDLAVATGGEQGTR